LGHLVRIVPAVLRQVSQHPTMREEFMKAHELLSEAHDPWSWENLGAVPAKDPEHLPDGAFIMPIGNGGWLTYWLRPDGDLEVIMADLPEPESE
jgi:hypothetical protein